MACRRGLYARVQSPNNLYLNLNAGVKPASTRWPPSETTAQNTENHRHKNEGTHNGEGILPLIARNDFDIWCLTFLNRATNLNAFGPVVVHNLNKTRKWSECCVTC